MTSRSPILGFLFVAAAFGTVALVFWPTVDALTTRYDTYRHIGLILAAFVVIVWRKRLELAYLPIRPFWLGLIVIVGVGFIWLTGEMLFVRIFTDVAIVVMVSATVLTVFGYRWLWALSFPLSFLLFAIPIGGPLVPILVDWTAKFAVIGLQASRVPIHQEGAYFMIPSGNWSIAEACSGIGYFSTCVMLGCLYAWTLYRSALKRIVFVVGAATIGVIGNWIRVYLTVMIAHLSENRLLRDDHSAFGWVVFAVLFLVYCYLGLKFRDDEPSSKGVADHPTRATDQSVSDNPRSSTRLQILISSVAVLATLAIWPIIQTATVPYLLLRTINIADIDPQRGWSSASNPFTNWVPELQNPLRTRVQVFEKGGRRVGVFIGIFRNQTWNSKLVTSVNQLASDDNPDWKLFVRGVAQVEFSGDPLVVETGVVDGLGIRIVAWRWYWINGVSTSSGPLAKTQQMIARLQGKDDTSAWIAIYSEANVSTDDATKMLEEFMRDMGGPLERSLRITTQ